MQEPSKSNTKCETRAGFPVCVRLDCNTARRLVVVNETKDGFGYLKVTPVQQEKRMVDCLHCHARSQCIAFLIVVCAPCCVSVFLGSIPLKRIIRTYI